MNALRALEQAVLAEGREWTRRRLETQLQAQSDALPAHCPQSGLPLQDTRWRDLQLHTVAGGEARAPRGSGAAESLGKQLQQRLRGCGQAWSRPGLKPRATVLTSARSSAL